MDPLIHNLISTLLTGIICQGELAFYEYLAEKNFVSRNNSRKLVCYFQLKI